MQVILQENVKNLGSVGDLVNVKDGYARNFLLPKKLALVASVGRVKEFEHQKRGAEAKKAKELKKVQDIANELSKIRLQLDMEAGEDGKLFGSVTTRDVADLIHKNGITIDRHDLKMGAIKALGEHEVEVKLPLQVSVTLKINIVKK